jgi:L-2,4-diaminobutyrate decarboxylase
VDAAYGGALALSGRDAGLLEGIALADSVTIDFHKLFFQPISCSLLLVGDAAAWETIRFHADYLNPEEHLEEGVPDLVTKSIQTTRRFDGLKVFVTLQVLGRDGYAALIDRCLSLARAAGGLIAEDPELELACEPMIASVVFRYQPTGLAPEVADHANRVARRKLLQAGEALIGFTKVNERAFVKFTLMNPLTSLADVRVILAVFKREAGAAVEEARSSRT